MPETGPTGQTELSGHQHEGTACIDCGTADGPLHRGEAITTRVYPGVLRDTKVVRCSGCLVKQQRYVPEQLPVDGRGRHDWGIRDRETGELVLNGDEIERFPWRDGAVGWIRRQDYLDSAWPR